MPVQQLPTYNFSRMGSALGEFPGYTRNMDADVEARLRALQAADQAAGQQRDIAASQQNLATQQRGETQRAQIAARASTAPARMQQQRFNTVYGDIRNQLGQMGATFGQVGGQSPPSPEITVGGVWSPDQVQQQVNAARAGNDQATQARQAVMQRQMAGRGFGANSPLAMALGVGMGNQNLATNTGAEREIRWNAAQGNAQHQLATQQAREQQFASRQDEDIRRRQSQLQAYSALLGALGGLV